MKFIVDLFKIEVYAYYSRTASKVPSTLHVLVGYDTVDQEKFLN